MNTFSIDTENNIQAHAEAPASGTPAEVFSTQQELTKLSAPWPASRLAEVWNSFAGVAPFDDLKPVKKFTSRKAAIARIWQAVQRLSSDLAPQAAHVAPVEARSRKGAAKKTRRNVARPGAKAARRGVTEAREGSKKAAVLALLRRAKGATLPEIMKATHWQAHTVRGFISGTLTKKLRLAVESTRPDGKERTYRVLG